MDLEENMYIRTFGGIIIKLEDLEFDICFRIDMGINKPFWRNGNFNNQIKKSSKNIIDLIKTGDYVNGNKIIKISTDFCGRNILIYGYDDGDRQVAITIYEDEIKSIVTKEQFKSIEYTVKE